MPENSKGKRIAKKHGNIRINLLNNFIAIVGKHFAERDG